MTAADASATPETRRRAPAWLVAATAAMATLILVLAVVETSITAAWLVDTRGEFISLFGVAFILAAGLAVWRQGRLYPSLPLVLPWLLYPIVTQGDQIIDNLSIDAMRTVCNVLLVAIFAEPVAVVVIAARSAFDASGGGSGGASGGASGSAARQVPGWLAWVPGLRQLASGLRLRAGRVDASVTAFDIEYRDGIERRAIAFDRNIVGSTISGFEIVRQDANGLAFIAQDIRPVATRVNAGHARLLGFEAEGHIRLTARLGLHAQTSMTNGRVLATGDYLRRMPPPLGSAGLRWSTDRFVVDGTLSFAGRQTRFNSADLTDARIGGVRTRASIASFFNGTATDKGLVAGGLLLQTGETLAQVQTRVLGDAASAPLYSSAPGFVALSARMNLKLSSRVNLIAIGENLTDRNYRLYGSGADAPGANLQVRLRASF